MCCYIVQSNYSDESKSFISFLLLSIHENKNEKKIVLTDEHQRSLDRFKIHLHDQHTSDCYGA